MSFFGRKTEHYGKHPPTLANTKSLSISNLGKKHIIHHPNCPDNSEFPTVAYIGQIKLEYLSWLSIIG
jgi:hypothetical protein